MVKALAVVSPQITSFGAAGLVFVTLTFNGQSRAAMPRPLRIVPPFNVSYVNPHFVPTHSVSTIWMTGTSVGHDRFVNASELLHCRWNGTVLTKAQYLNITTLFCSTPNLTEVGSHTVQLTFNLQQFSAPLTVHTFPPIVLEWLTPTHVLDQGGAVVTVHGTGFRDRLIISYF